jgi:hypothetical protein
MSFSKALLGLAAVSVFSTLASAQTLSCIAQPVDTPALRDNGVTERVGDLKIVCTGGTPTPTGQFVPQFNLQIFTSPAINVTSRIIGGDVSEALMLIDEPDASIQSLCGSNNTPTTTSAAGTCPIVGNGTGLGIYNGATTTVTGTPAVTNWGRPNAFVARRVGENSLVWNGIPFDPPGTGPARVLRLTNIRLNASQLNNVRGGATSVNIIISTTSSGVANSIQVPIGNPAPTVGIAQTPMDFSAKSGSFLQCESQNVSSTTGLVSTTLAGADTRLNLTFTERFASALRRRSAANAADFSVVPTPTSSNVLTNTQLFETESGFYNAAGGSAWNLSLLGFTTAADATRIGVADTGTRLLARFKNLPSGATFYASNHATLSQVNTSGIVTGDAHGTVSDANGAGAYSSVGAIGGITAITPVSGAGTFVWEVIRTNTTVTETATIPVALAYVANTSNNLPTLGSATADGQLAPLSTTATASSTATIPRFVEDTVNNNKALFTINACRSNLLFPFIVNGGGYETGMAIVNTTKDPWGTQSQTGNCTVVFYGRSGTSDVCLTQQSNKSISGGQFLAWTLGGGGDVPATPNFTGYAIAQCNFQYGHGFAFITDTRVERVAHGYLALVLDDPIADRGKRTGSKSEVLGN